MALRIGTFNAQFLPYLLSNGRRARSLAERILKTEYDVLLLTEVFTDQVRRLLLRCLSADYPYSVNYIGSKLILREDSGLMLLSKLPFEPLEETPSYRHRRIRVSDSARDSGRPVVWFTEYDRCCSSDCLSGKGAAYVRLKTDGRPLHVFFTHMQAKYDFHGPRKQRLTRSIRASQIGQLTALMRDALGPGKGAGENVVVLGDLNVDGIRPGAAPEDDAVGGEWREMMRTLATTTSRGLEDAWERYASTADPGFTYPAWAPEARRDYIFVSLDDQEYPLSVRRVALAHHPKGTEVLSDHLGIDMDLEAPV